MYTGGLSVALRCGTLTLNICALLLTERLVFKGHQMAEVAAGGTPQYNTYTCVGARAGLKVENNLKRSQNAFGEVTSQ